MKKLLSIVLLFTAITLAKAQPRSSAVAIEGSENFVAAVRQSLNSIPYLQAGTVSGGPFHFSAYINPAAMDFIVDGHFSINYFNVTMPDGKVFKYVPDGDHFICRELPQGYISSISFAGARLKINQASCLSNSLSSINPSLYIHVNRKPDIATDVGRLSYEALHSFGTTRDSDGKQIYTGLPVEVRNIVAARPYLSIQASGLTEEAYNQLKKDVEWIRDAYTKWKEQNQQGDKPTASKTATTAGTASGAKNTSNASAQQRKGRNKKEDSSKKQQEEQEEQRATNKIKDPRTGQEYTYEEMQAMTEEYKRQQQEKIERATKPGEDLIRTSGVDKQQATEAVAGLATGIANGSLNIGVRLAAPEDLQYKGLEMPKTIGITFGYFRGTEAMLKEKGKRYPLPWGMYTFASKSINVPKEEDYSFSSVRDGYAETMEFGAMAGVGVLKLVEIMPAVGVSWDIIEGTPKGGELLQENRLGIHAGGMGRFGYIYYGADYNFTTKHISFTFGLSLGKKR